jgi:hypothetical protein
MSISELKLSNPVKLDRASSVSSFLAQTLQRLGLASTAYAQDPEVKISIQEPTPMTGKFPEGLEGLKTMTHKQLLHGIQSIKDGNNDNVDKEEMIVEFISNSIKSVFSSPTALGRSFLVQTS